MKTTKDFTFFFTGNDYLSNWYQCKFEGLFSDINYEFCCVEQYMMFAKAMLFCDYATAKEILKTKDPKNHKNLGRMVKNFDEHIWKLHCADIVYKGCEFKFLQNRDLLLQLLDTTPTLLVEASPYDKIWGIGLSENDKNALDMSKWKGENKLGKILTNLRNDFLKQMEKL